MHRADARGAKAGAFAYTPEDSVVSTIRRTKTFLDKLNVGASDYLNHGRVFEIPVDPEHEDRKLGMCGTLRPYLPEGELIARPAELQNDAEFKQK